jgi:branched-chain amino acid transport system ATP-binding protein
VLELSGVAAGYGGSDVLQGVDLTVERGSITCIVGPNGAGKSTVLRSVSGLLAPSNGTITLEGRSIGGLAPREILSMGVVQVPQSGALFPSLSVRENVLMGAYIHRRDRALLRERYLAVEDIVPFLRERGDDRAGNLSGGQRRFVEFARCLMLDPQLVLLDEPSLGLDPGSLTLVFELIGRMHEDGKTLVLVEQNVRLGLAVATQAVVMENGRVRMTGDPADVLGNPAIAELYLGGTVRRVDAPDGGAGATREGSADRAAP